MFIRWIDQSGQSIVEYPSEILTFSGANLCFGCLTWNPRQEVTGHRLEIRSGKKKKNHRRIHTQTFIMPRMPTVISSTVHYSKRKSVFGEPMISAVPGKQSNYREPIEC